MPRIARDFGDMVRESLAARSVRPQVCDVLAELATEVVRQDLVEHPAGDSGVLDVSAEGAQSASQVCDPTRLKSFDFSKFKQLSSDLGLPDETIAQVSRLAEAQYMTDAVQWEPLSDKESAALDDVEAAMAVRSQELVPPRLMAATEPLPQLKVRAGLELASLVRRNSE